MIFALLAAAAPVSAAERQWATVNVCDTATHPDAMGVRARMAGNGKRQRMYMRFRSQFFSESASRWETVSGSAGASRWIYVGSARRAYAEGGWTFEFDPPSAGRAFRLRGVADLRWTDRRGRKVMRRTKVVTEAGHPGTRGADPSSYSSELCEIR